MATDSEVQHKRATVRSDKGDAVTAMVESFRSSSAALLTEYRGLTVKQITALRVALGADTTYSVVKNSLTQIAAREAGLSGLDELLVGPVAVAFVGGDPVAAAKGLRDFAKTNPALVVKGGVMDGRALSADEIKKLADLESREVLLAKMAGAMKASLTQAVYLLAAPLAQAARAIGALEAKAQQDPSVLAGGAGTPAPVAEDTATEDTNTEDTATDQTAAVETEPAGAGEASAVADEAPVAQLADVTLEASDGSADSTTDTPA